MGSIVKRSTGYVTTSQTDPNAVNEIQTVTLTSFDGTDSFTLTYGGATSSAVTRGTNYSSSGVKAVVEAMAAFTGGTVTVYDTAGTTTALTDGGFRMVFSGSVGGKNLTAFSVNGTGCSGSVAETTKGRACKTVTMGLGCRYGQVLRVRAGLFEDASSNDLDITDSGSRSVWVASGVDTNVSGASYDEFRGDDGTDQAGNAVTGQLLDVFEGPLTIKVKTDAAASGTVDLFVRGIRQTNEPKFRERSTGTFVVSAGGAGSSSIHLGEPYAIVRRFYIYGFDSSTDLTITDALSKTIYTKTGLNAAAGVNVVLGEDGINASGSAAANVLPAVVQGPLTVTIANGGTSTSGYVKVWVEV